MNDELLNLKEVSALLKVNTEVLRRWLRSGKLPGIKIGSDWRVKFADLAPLFVSSENSLKIVKKKNSSSLKKMSTACPRWLEHSGLPKLLNDKYGPEGWPIFKKLIELDLDYNRPVDRYVPYNVNFIAEVTGYEMDFVENIVKSLCADGYVSLKILSPEEIYFKINTPIKTPKLIFDIEYENGGVLGAPQPTLNNPCLRRFLES